VDTGLVRLFRHGGDINAARAVFPHAPEPWIDLSTGINPEPYPLPAFDPAAWMRLPSPAEIETLAEVAAVRYRARPEQVVVAPGTQALLQWLPRLYPAARVAIPGPTYGGHASAWRLGGAEVVESLVEATHAVVVNPNNPDGRRTPLPALRALAERLTLLVVDEAFADFEPETLAADLPPNTVVLRSFGKTYGLAGARLGFAIARANLARQLRDALGAWAVGGPTLEIGRAALADSGWLEQARACRTADADWLDARLEAAGFVVIGGTPLFRLAARPDADACFQRMGEAGVLVRPFAYRRDWLRFGLPRTGDRARVAAALQAAGPTSRASYPLAR
jgi:cobalamin biosynthetic protein CobC